MPFRRSLGRKGKGLVATRKIHRGTRILSEVPILRLPKAVLNSQTLPASIRRQVDALTADRRQAFLSIASSGTLSMHCEISRKARRLHFTTSEFSTTAKTAKKLFEENLRLPARVVFASCRRIRVKTAEGG
jgi:hypothetical protein